MATLFLPQMICIRKVFLNGTKIIEKKSVSPLNRPIGYFDYVTTATTYFIIFCHKIQYIIPTERKESIYDFAILGFIGTHRPTRN